MIGTIVRNTIRSGPVTAAARTMSRGRLRILGYHGVPDADRFAAQMRYLAAEYTPVTSEQIAAALKGAELPARSVWVTFDDGDPSVVAKGLPTLVDLGIPATMFVCPGLIESREPFWWRLSEWDDPTGTSTETLKTITDGDRRRTIDDLADRYPTDYPEPWRQLDSSELRAWLDAGMELGNHTWDHPCLDQCDDDAQREQIRRTHDWLTDLLGAAPTLFAYPNGNFSAVVDAEIKSLGYELGLLYDHRLAPRSSPPHQLSRLMVEADQDAERLIGVLSGVQPALAGILDRF